MNRSMTPRRAPRPPLRMMARLRSRLRRFGRDQGGSAALEYVLMLPVIFGLFLMSVDSGISTTRAALLDRAVDMTARSIRNGTLATASLGAVRSDLCARLTVYPNCTTDLKVQLVAVSRNSFAMPAATMACADQGAAITPVRKLVVGQDNSFAVLRACMSLTPYTPAALLAGPSGYVISAATVLAGSAS